MKKVFSKYIAMMLAAFMMVTAIPFTAFAAPSWEIPSTVVGTIEENAVKDVAVGQVYDFVPAKSDYYEVRGNSGYGGPADVYNASGKKVISYDSDRVGLFKAEKNTKYYVEIKQGETIEINRVTSSVELVDNYVYASFPNGCTKFTATKSGWWVIYPKRTEGEWYSVYDSSMNQVVGISCGKDTFWAEKGKTYFLNTENQAEFTIKWDEENTSTLVFDNENGYTKTVNGTGWYKLVPEKAGFNSIEVKDGAFELYDKSKTVLLSSDTTSGDVKKKIFIKEGEELFLNIGISGVEKPATVTIKPENIPVKNIAPKADFPGIYAEETVGNGYYELKVANPGVYSAEIDYGNLRLYSLSDGIIVNDNIETFDKIFFKEDDKYYLEVSGLDPEDSGMPIHFTCYEVIDTISFNSRETVEKSYELSRVHKLVPEESGHYLVCAGDGARFYNEDGIFIGDITNFSFEKGKEYYVLQWMPGEPITIQWDYEIAYSIDDASQYYNWYGCWDHERDGSGDLLNIPMARLGGSKSYDVKPEDAKYDFIKCEAYGSDFGCIGEEIFFLDDLEKCADEPLDYGMYEEPKTVVYNKPSLNIDFSVEFVNQEGKEPDCYYTWINYRLNSEGEYTKDSGSVVDDTNTNKNSATVNSTYTEVLECVAYNDKYSIKKTFINRIVGGTITEGVEKKNLYSSEYYEFTPSKTGYYNIETDVDFHVYDESGEERYLIADDITVFFKADEKLYFKCDNSDGCSIKISVNQTKDLQLDANGAATVEDGIYRFVPTKSGKYEFEIAGNSASYEVFDSLGKKCDKKITFEAGKEYYLEITGVKERTISNLKVKQEVKPIQTGWQKINNVWYYFNASGEKQTGWQKINNKWYYMNASGAMLTGWQKVNNKWYYMNASGAMLTGWQEIKGKWYYLTDSGAMAANTWIGKYYVDGNGVWTKTR